MSSPYRKPSEVGGTLIRRVLALFKERGFPLPLQTEIYIAVSGGVDSMVLAHLLCTYGRKVCSPEQITVLHFDHGWRKESATTEKKLVEKFAESLGVKFLHRALPKPSERMSQNLEEDARLKRVAVYDELTKRERAIVLTAHHEDDAVESLFWRFLRGEFLEYREGILFSDSGCLRPFLKVTKEEILRYAQAEKVKFAKDPTNDHVKHFRAWMRKLVFPLLETQFPQIKKVLARYLTKGKVVPIEQQTGLEDAIQAVTGTGLNRAQRLSLHEMTKKLKLGATLSLPGGHQIRRTREGFLIENLDESDQRK